MLQRWVLSAVILTVGIGFLPAPSQAASKKDETTAGLLGGLLGFGAGYYYDENYGKGAMFTGIDLGLGIGAAVINDDAWRLGLGLGFLASHVYQGIDGANEATRYNKKHGLGFFGMDLPVMPNIGMSAFSDTGSDQIAQLWAHGGADRDRAWALSQWRGMQRPFKLNIGMADPGVGMAWSGKF